MSAQLTVCRSCRAPIYLLVNERTRNRAPINAEPAGDGNCLLNLERGTYSVVRPRELTDVRHAMAGRLYLSHYVTCPQRQQWKRGN